MQEFNSLLEESDVFSSCLPLWHNENDITIPAHFRHMHGIHAYTELGQTIACDYFVVYENHAYTEAQKETGAGLAVCAWDNIAHDNQRAIEAMGQRRSDYDSGKVLTLLMAARGARINFQQSETLKHIGGFTEAGAVSNAMLYCRGRLDKLADRLPGMAGGFAIHAADIWYALTRGRKDNTRRENINLASRIRRRTSTARYFYLLIVGLMDDKPLPVLPRLGDDIAEKRIAAVTEDIRLLVKRVRSEPGPWQDQ
jgi:hypothetical protein